MEQEEEKEESEEEEEEDSNFNNIKTMFIDSLIHSSTQEEIPRASVSPCVWVPD